MKIRRKESERHIPVLRGVVNRNEIAVICPYCDCWHYHSYAKGEGLSHRVAHCGTPERMINGYYIAPLRKSDLERLKKAAK